MRKSKIAGYLYKTDLTIGGQTFVYVGKRQRTKFSKSYFGSGVAITRLIKQRQYDSIKVNLISYHSNIKELAASERQLIVTVREQFGERCLNLGIGGEGIGKAKFWTLKKCQAAALQYSTRTEWARSSPGSYSAAQMQGWINRCSVQMVPINEPDGYWTLRRCEKFAQQFKTRSEWKKAPGSSYGVACNKGWLDACSKHMDRLFRPDGYWTEDKCRVEAQRFYSKSEWRKNHPASHSAAFKAGWFDQVCSHMQVQAKPRGFWTFDRCLSDARQYQSRGSWQAESGTAYRTARVNGWLDACCLHMNQKRVPNGYWNFDRCLEQAGMFQSKQAWKKNSSGSFSFAYDRGWVDECFSCSRKCS